MEEKLPQEFEHLFGDNHTKEAKAMATIVGYLTLAFRQNNPQLKMRGVQLHIERTGEDTALMTTEINDHKLDFIITVAALPEREKDVQLS